MKQSILIDTRGRIMKTELSLMLATAAILATGAAIAEDKESKWRFAAGSETGADFFLDPTTFRNHTREGATTIRVDGKYVKPDGKVELVIYEVSKEDCSDKTGFLRMLDMEGRATSRNDFAFRVNSTASGIAKVVCARVK